MSVSGSPAARLVGRTALVTGANHGIGAATAERLARDGAEVVVAFYRPAFDGVELTATTPGRDFYVAQQSRDGELVAAGIRAAGGRSHSIELDLSKLDAAEVLFDFAEERFGAVNVLINNAAHCVGDTFDPRRGLEESPAGHTSAFFSADEFDRHIAVNTRAVGLLMSEFARRHISREADWARIVNVSTDAAANFPTTVSYGASKFAAESLSRSAAVELAPYGITVNIVAPGPIQTGYISPDNEPAVRAMIPLGRLGEPRDVADVIAFLASDDARWLTGQILYVGGGSRMA